MLATPLILAGILIVTAILVKKEPKLIAGYEEILKSIDDEAKLAKAANILCRNLIIASASTILLCYLTYYFESEPLFVVSLILPCLISVVASVYRINKMT